MSQTVNWGGYTLQVCDIDGTWTPAPGVYVFAGLVDGVWRPHYVGRTDNFATRMANHDRWPEAARAGATHVLAMVVPSPADRVAIEQKMIEELQPALNNHYR